MNTHTHVIMGAALFGAKVPKRAWAGAVGGLVPDIPMMVIFLVAKIYGIPTFLIFTVLYWEDWWQITNAIAHNFFIWGSLLAAGLYLQRAVTCREWPSGSTFSLWRRWFSSLHH